MKLNLSPGACIFEAGTGSGSFTHFLARTVARGPPAANGQGQTSNVWQTQRDSLTPAISNVHESEYEGRVYSFEFHAERVERARKEFASTLLIPQLFLNIGTFARMDLVSQTRLMQCS